VDISLEKAFDKPRLIMLSLHYNVYGGDGEYHLKNQLMIVSLEEKPNQKSEKLSSFNQSTDASWPSESSRVSKPKLNQQRNSRRSLSTLKTRWLSSLKRSRNGLRRIKSFQPRCLLLNIRSFNGRLVMRRLVRRVGIWRRN
jgi:hypothetical protein